MFYMERVWIIVAGLCLIVAAVALLWRWNIEVAFVAATLGVVALFLNYRDSLQKKVAGTGDAARAEDEDYGEQDEG